MKILLLITILTMLTSCFKSRHVGTSIISGTLTSISYTRAGTSCTNNHIDVMNVTLSNKGTSKTVQLNDNKRLSSHIGKDIVITYKEMETREYCGEYSSIISIEKLDKISQNTNNMKFLKNKYAYLIE